MPSCPAGWWQDPSDPNLCETLGPGAYVGIVAGVLVVISVLFRVFFVINKRSAPAPSPAATGGPTEALQPPVMVNIDKDLPPAVPTVHVPATWSTKQYSYTTTDSSARKQEGGQHIQ